MSASCAPNHVLHEVLLRPSDIALGLQRPGYVVEHVVFLKRSNFEEVSDGFLQDECSDRDQMCQAMESWCGPSL